MTDLPHKIWNIYFNFNLFTIKIQIQNKDIKPILKSHDGGNAIKANAWKTLYPHTIKQTGSDRTIQRQDSTLIYQCGLR